MNLSHFSTFVGRGTDNILCQTILQGRLHSEPAAKSETVSLQSRGRIYLLSVQGRECLPLVQKFGPTFLLSSYKILRFPEL